MSSWDLWAAVGNQAQLSAPGATQTFIFGLDGQLWGKSIAEPSAGNLGKPEYRECQFDNDEIKRVMGALGADGDEKIVNYLQANGLHIVHGTRHQVISIDGADGVKSTNKESHSIICVKSNQCMVICVGNYDNVRNVNCAALNLRDKLAQAGY